MLLEIQAGTDNKILRKKSVQVGKIDKRIRKLAKDLTETMLAKDGVGIAAPQVGVNERIAILNFQIKTKEFRPLVLINPEIVDASLEMETAEEGCLSLPGIFGKVARFREVIVRFTDEKSVARTLQLTGLNARAVQHEIDHLDGVLFVDRLTEKNHLPNGVAL